MDAIFAPLVPTTTVVWQISSAVSDRETRGLLSKLHGSAALRHMQQLTGVSHEIAPEPESRGQDKFPIASSNFGKGRFVVPTLVPELARETLHD